MPRGASVDPCLSRCVSGSSARWRRSRVNETWCSGGGVRGCWSRYWSLRPNESVRRDALIDGDLGRGASGLGVACAGQSRVPHARGRWARMSCSRARVATRSSSTPSASTRAALRRWQHGVVPRWQGASRSERRRCWVRRSALWRGEPLADLGGRACARGRDPASGGRACGRGRGPRGRRSRPWPARGARARAAESGGCRSRCVSVGGRS